ncbi:MAG: hypothetical protein EHM70_05710 [Chloroflexota bacterium]|nr:MAG: hypothetical protein EHM70_05710 [Chloroflexota bacterium]
MRKNYWLIVLLFIWLFFPSATGFTFTSPASNDAILQLERRFITPNIPTNPQEESPHLSRITGIFTSTLPFNEYLPMITVSCHLAAGLPADTTATIDNTYLYNGPGNLDYDILANLDTCTIVSAKAIYADFVKVEASVNGERKAGFVKKSDLFPIPENLPKLTLDQVPWRDQNLVDHFTINPGVILYGNDIVVDNSNSDDYNGESPLFVELEMGFRLTFLLSDSDTQYASIQISNKDYDGSGEWWQGIQRVDFATLNHKMIVNVRDGKSEFSSTIIDLNISDNQLLSVNFLDPFGKIFTILDQSNHEILRIDVTNLPGVSLPEGLFPEKAAYFGRSVSPHGQLTIKSLSLLLAPSGAWHQPAIVATEPTLRHLAEAKNISVGTEYAWQLMRDSRYWQTMFGVYNTAILSDFSSTTFWRNGGDYDFAKLDRIVDWLIKNGFRVRASHLVWGAYPSIPAWLLNGNFSRDEYIQILHDHISTVVGHYKGRVTEWSIANEAASRSWGTGNDFWADKIGPDYVEMSFRWAREADPTGTLIFNDDLNYSLADQKIGVVANKMLTMVTDLKGKGVPIDVVGMQMHLLLPWSSQEPPDKTNVIYTMQQFANLGVKIYITEFDVNLHNIAGTQDERWAFEENLYRDMISACLESGVCTSFATWGISDANSWISCSYPGCLNFPDAEPLMFDVNYQPKPAYYVIKNAFATRR